jgi:hypothetical protein
MPLETSVAVAAALMSFTVNSIPIEARLLKSSVADGCIQASERARLWRESGSKVIEQRIGGWCVVGTVIDQHWVAEQWWMAANRGQAHGWRVRIPVKSIVGNSHTPNNSWPLDISDASTRTRTSVRRSSLSLAEHHAQSRRLAGLSGKEQQRDSGSNSPRLLVTHSGTGALLISGSYAPGESYSVLIDRQTGD